MPDNKENDEAAEVLIDEAGDLQRLPAIWASLPVCAQRLVLCESARLTRSTPGYDRVCRSEHWNGQSWQVSSEGDAITLVGNIGNSDKLEGQISANRLRSKVGELHQKITQLTNSVNVGKEAFERDSTLMHVPDRVNALNKVQEELARAQQEVKAAENDLTSAERAADMQTEVIFRFPPALWEGEGWE